MDPVRRAADVFLLAAAHAAHALLGNCFRLQNSPTVQLDIPVCCVSCGCWCLQERDTKSLHKCRAGMCMKQDLQPTAVAQCLPSIPWLVKAPTRSCYLALRLRNRYRFLNSPAVQLDVPCVLCSLLISCMEWEAGPLHKFLAPRAGHVVLTFATGLACTSGTPSTSDVHGARSAVNSVCPFWNSCGGLCSWAFPLCSVFPAGVKACRRRLSLSTSTTTLLATSGTSSFLVQTEESRRGCWCPGRSSKADWVR